MPLGRSFSSWAQAVRGKRRAVAVELSASGFVSGTWRMPDGSGSMLRSQIWLYSDLSTWDESWQCLVQKAAHQR